jgi:hypothetical protein
VQGGGNLSVAETGWAVLAASAVVYRIAPRVGDSAMAYPRLDVAEVGIDYGT